MANEAESFDCIVEEVVETDEMFHDFDDNGIGLAENSLDSMLSQTADTNLE